MRKVLIVGNWKMHFNVSEASLLVHRLQENVKIRPNLEVVLAPSFLALQPLSLQIDHRKFRLAAQDAYFKDEGAYTGEVSFTMLRGLVHYAIVGHSERRHIFNEDLVTVRQKLKACVRNGITPILCIGETAQERADGETKQVLHDQLSTALADLTASEIGELVIAYEPVWAISNGKDFENHDIASPADIKAIVDYIRGYIADVFGEGTGHSVRLLYGGSTVPDIVGGFLEESGVDGFLVGGASLNWHDFSAIIDNAYAWQRSGGRQ